MFRDKLLRGQMLAVYDTTFTNEIVTPGAKEQLQGFITVGVNAFNKQPNDEAYKRILANYTLFCNEVLKFKVEYKDELLGFVKSKVTEASVKKAKFSLCPLWPFC